MNKAPVPLDGGNLHRLIRVLTAWRTDPGYQDESGKPIDLPLRGAAPSLHQLCLIHGRNAPTRVIADAIVESGNAEWIGESDSRKIDKRLRYLHPVVTADEDSEEDIAILIQVMSDFMYSIQATLNPEIKPRPRFREGYFNDIDATKVDEVLMLVYEKMQIFGVECTELLKQYCAEEGKPVVRLGVGTYSFLGAPLFIGKDPEDEE
ncbi:MAG: hypothetical protein KY410_08620 [Proteobacteria bacterium]|nr:hypothetical protein [Pseudomonadota bacterium]